jgi:predicted secreted protein with PEFG-CTERM motif
MNIDIENQRDVRFFYLVSILAIGFWIGVHLDINFPDTEQNYTIVNYLILHILPDVFAEDYDLEILWKGQPYELSETEKKVFQDKLAKGECDFISACLEETINWYNNVEWKISDEESEIKNFRLIEYSCNADGKAIMIHRVEGYDLNSIDLDSLNCNLWNEDDWISTDDLNTVTDSAKPEFGTIAVMILAVAIISIIAVSAKSRLSILPRY